MPQRLSNQLRVSLFIGGIEVSGMNIHQEDVSTVQTYHYDFKKGRNKMGVPVSDPSMAYLEIELRNNSQKITRHFLKELKHNTPYDYSLLFNITFDENRRLKEYENIIEARGYVVELEESFDNYSGEESKKGQTILTVKLLLTKLSFTNNFTDSSILISND